MKIREIISIILINLVVLVGLVQAKTKVAPPVPPSPPQIIMSWSAQSLAPSWYPGKIFPNHGSQIEIGMDLLDNGRPVDLSKNTIRWYVNNKPVISARDGLGIKNYSFRFSGYPEQDIEVRAEVVDYQNGEPIGGAVTIPLTHSEVVIDAPYPGRKISRIAFFIAHPFFFSASDASKLSFNWVVNNQAAASDASNPWILNLKIDSAAPSGFEINLQAAIRNLTDELDFSGDSVRLNLK